MFTIRKLQAGEIHKEKKMMSKEGSKYCKLSFYWNCGNSQLLHIFQLLYTKAIAWFLLITSIGVYMLYRHSSSILIVNAHKYHHMHTTSTHSDWISSACLTLKAVTLRSTEWCLLQIKESETEVYFGFTTSKFIIKF